ncbi:MAG TPA: EamA family transporter [Anaerolineales bacterium]|jgi:drug/metabolite transporter (DMT)-like permease
MSLPAIGLLFLSAALHTFWNLLLKQAGGKYIATFWTVVLSGLIFAPVLFFTGLPPRSQWPLLLISAIVEVAYFLSLSQAYQDHDFSLIYPVARGTAPAFLTLWSILILGERLTRGGAAGLALIVIGLMVAGGSSYLAGGVPPRRALVLALLTALFISIYSFIDGFAVKHGPTVSYAIGIFTLIPILITPFVLLRYPRALLQQELSANWKRLALIAVLGVCSYILALTAYALAPLSYAGAIREVSVVFGAFAGWRLLGEKMGGARLFGAAIIFAGILMIALFG